MKPEVILDKSYLEGQNDAVIKQLCADYSVLMLETLFMELLTTSEKYFQAACFRKFPETENPVELINGISSLLQYEIKHQRQATPLLNQKIPIRFAFNPKMASGNYIYSAEQLVEMRRWEVQILEDVDFLKENAEVTADFFPSIPNYKPGQSTAEIELIRKEIAYNEDLIRGFYARIRHATFPPAELLSPNWAFFRWVQVKLLASVEFIRRYGPGRLDVRSKEIAQDVADSEYLICASLAGGLATRDSALKRDFTLLCPNGLLLN